MSQRIKVQLLKLTATVPSRMSTDAAGYDLYACLVVPCVELRIREYSIIGTGIALEIPRGYEGQIRSRSGLAAKHGITVLNAPGTVDADYRGEVGVLLVNNGPYDYVIHDGDRIAQLVIAPIQGSWLEVVDELDTTERGDGGFGSTGIR